MKKTSYFRRRILSIWETITNRLVGILRFRRLLFWLSTPPALIILALITVWQILTGIPIQTIIDTWNLVHIYWSDSVLPLLGQYPYLYPLWAVALAVIFFLFLAYWETRQPNGISIVPVSLNNWTGITVENNTHNRLVDCWVQMRYIRRKEQGRWGSEIWRKVNLAWSYDPPHGSERITMDDGEAKSAYYFVGYDPDDFDEYHSQNIFMGREAAGAEVVENGEYEVSLRFGGISLDNATIKRSAWMVLSANGDDSSINEFVT